MSNAAAKARIPTRPLSYEHVGMAQPKELIVDYKNHAIYICDADGNVISASTTIETADIVKDVLAQLEANPDTIKDVKITLEDGTVVTLEEGIKNNSALLSKIFDASGNLILKVPAAHVTTTDNLQFVSKAEKEKWSKIEDILDEEGNIVIGDSDVKAENVITTTTLQFVSAEEKTAWNAKASIKHVNATILSDESKWTESSENFAYIQKLDIADILETDYPIVDVQLSDNYNTALTELNEYSKIYKILTYDGYIEIYATDPVIVDLNVIFKIDR